MSVLVRITLGLALWSCVVPAVAFSMNLYRVGEEITGESYNELLQKWFSRKLSLRVGVDESGKEYMVFIGEAGYGEAMVYVPYNDEEVENMLSKAKEWIIVARQHRADTDRVLGCFPEETFLSCQVRGVPSEENQMGVRFVSTNDGQFSRLILELADQSNRYKRATIYFDQQGINKLIKAAQQLEPALAKAKETARKQHLFDLKKKP
ncbi:MAG: hypothetical protein U0236_22145 [Nitrospira sp.]